MNDEALNIRLQNIEDTLKSLKDILVESKLQQQHIEEIDKDIVEIQESINIMDGKIAAIETKPEREKSVKFDSIVNLIFKILITAAIGFFLSKVGIPA